MGQHLLIRAQLHLKDLLSLTAGGRSSSVSSRHASSDMGHGRRGLLSTRVSFVLLPPPLLFLGGGRGGGGGDGGGSRGSGGVVVGLGRVSLRVGRVILQVLLLLLLLLLLPPALHLADPQQVAFGGDGGCGQVGRHYLLGKTNTVLTMATTTTVTATADALKGAVGKI